MMSPAFRRSHPADYKGPFVSSGPVHGGRLAHCVGGGVSNGAEPAAASTPLWRGGHRCTGSQRRRSQLAHGRDGGSRSMSGSLIASAIPR
jgi:hypothetical protein